MVGHHLLEGAESFCLEEEPLSVEQLLDLLEVVEDSLIQLFCILEEFVVLEEGHVLDDDAVLCNDSKL